MGPNFFIWIAIAVVVVSTLAGLYGREEIMWLGWAVAIVLALVNKVRAIRRRRSEQLRDFE
jgi:membrane protein implicated in regulation of membrane protease activity